jgi:glutaredoxin
MLPFGLLGETRFVLKTMLGRWSEIEVTNVTETPEDRYLAASGPRVVTLYTRPGCHLCEEAKAVIEPMLGEFGATLREVNIDADAVLRERYGSDIPVIFIGARKAAKHRVDAVKFRRQLRDAE